MDRQTRKDLKTDKFAVEAGHMFEFLTEHPDDIKALWHYCRCRSDPGGRDLLLSESSGYRP